MKVVLLDSQVISGYDYSVERRVIEDAGFEFVIESCKNEDEVIEKCLDADVVLNIALRLSEKSISQFKHCKAMIRYGIGVDEFDIEAATKKGIKICNVTTYCIDEVALHATSLILANVRQLPHFDKCVRNGLWNSNLGRKMRRPTTQTVGLVGFGNIPRKIAGFLNALGYNIISFDPYIPEETFKAFNVKKVELNELFGNANIISLHSPLNNDTLHMINKDSIAKMKDGVILINTSRGPLIKDEDLIDALKSGKVAAAGLDVMYAEPMKDKDNPYCNLENVILTPHIAYNSLESSNDLFKQVAETAVLTLQGETPANVLNAKALNLR